MDVVRELKHDQPPHSLTAEGFRTRAMSVEEVPGTFVSRVRVRLADPQLAASASTRTAEGFSDLTARIWHAWLTADRAQLETQTEAARAQLAEAEQNWLTMQLATPDTSTRVHVPRDIVTSTKSIPFADPDRPPARPKEPTLEDRLAQSRAQRESLMEARRRLGRSGRAAALGETYANEFEMVRLENEVEVRRKLFMDLSERLQSTRVQLASQPKPLRVLDRAVAPDGPLPSRRNRTVGLGVIAGLVLAGCLVVAKEWRRPEPLA